MKDETEFVDLNIFPAETYVVFLHGPTLDPNPWVDISINYCYKLREPSSTFNFKIIKDNCGIKNGWSPYSLHDTKGIDRLKLRLATHREISEYERLGGTPFDVTKLPKGEVVNDYFIF